MHLLILGLSNIVNRRVLPAARSLARVRQISIASRRIAAARSDAADSHPPIRWFDDYDRALATSGADAVYVSGVNAVHETWAMKGLARDLHVMIDKPAFPNVQAAEAAVALARRRGRGLAEATVFAFHPQVHALQSLVDQERHAAIRATAVFTIPARDAGDFRLRLECGGGSLYDLGPYAVAANRLLFRAAPADVHCRVLSTTASPAVDTSFSVLMTHQHGGALAGHFGFGMSYLNRLSVVTSTRAVDVERLFTTAPDAPCTLRMTERSGDRVVGVPAADAFSLFLNTFIHAMDRGDFAAFESALLDDARLLQRCREAARAA